MSLAINGRFLSQTITGVQRVARELSSRIESRVPDCTWFLPAGAVVNAPAVSGPIIFSTNILNAHLWEQTSLGHSLRKHGSPLLMNFTGVGPVLYRRKVCFSYDASLFRHPEWFSASYRSFYKTLMPIAFQNSEKIATISQFSKSEISQVFGVDPSRIIVVSPAAAQIFFEETTEREPLKQSTPYILAVGSFDPRKNLLRLIRATESLRNEGIRLLLIGNSHPAFRRHIEEVGKGALGVELISGVTDFQLRDLYRNAACLAFPSLYEGFGLPLVEAMAAGCPVVCSNNSSLPEIAGDAAIFVEAESERSILEGISRVVHSSQEQQRLKQLGFVQARTFSWDRSADILAKELISLM